METQGGRNSGKLCRNLWKKPATSPCLEWPCLLLAWVEMALNSFQSPSLRTTQDFPESDETKIDLRTETEIGHYIIYAHWLWSTVLLISKFFKQEDGNTKMEAWKTATSLRFPICHDGWEWKVYILSYSIPACCVTLVITYIIHWLSIIHGLRSRYLLKLSLVKVTFCNWIMCSVPWNISHFFLISYLLI
jgi:hypothetical protein